MSISFEPLPRKTLLIFSLSFLIFVSPALAENRARCRKSLQETEMVKSALLQKLNEPDKYPYMVQRFRSDSFANERQCFEWLIDHFLDHRLTRAEWRALDRYMGSSYQFNGYLRGKFHDISPEVLKEIDLIDSAIQNTTVPSELYVYRFMYDGEAGLNSKTLENTIYTDPGFVGTSLSMSMIDKIDSERIAIRIRIPKGFHATTVVRLDDPIHGIGSDMAGLRVEKEIILPRGTKFKVVANRPFRDTRILDLEPVP